MFYPNIKFKRIGKRPTFFTNFVSTLDGKVAVQGNAGKRYWPIGSRKDYEVLLELRARADALIHGKTTASQFPTVKSIAQPSFARMRRRIGKKRGLLYIVVSASPDVKLLANLRNNLGIKPLLVTTRRAPLAYGAENIVDVARMGEKAVDLPRFARYLKARGVKHALLEGGPTLLGSFFAADLIDEVFLTLAPKIFGGGAGKTLTMVEGALLPPEKVKHFQLLSAKKAGDEMFLRYRGE